MCARARVLSVVGMRPSLLPGLTAAAATAAVLAVSPPALAADAVYGGSTRSGDPIVLKADSAAATMRKLVISWEASCGEGGSYAGRAELTPVKPTVGFAPGSQELLVSQNAKGRVKGVQLVGYDLGANVAAVQVEFAGKLKPKNASGTLSAIVKIVDKATGNAVTSCQTGTLRWTAARDPGFVYGGTTSQGEPIVVRLDQQRKRVNDLLFTWRAGCTPSNGFFRIPEHFGGFPVKGNGSFGNPISDDYPLTEGGKRNFTYQIAGRVGKPSIKGTLQVKVTETDPAGAPVDGCDSGTVTWKAATG